MSRLTASSFLGALAGVALAASAAAAPAPAASPDDGLDESAMAGAIDATLGKIFADCRDAVVRVESEDELGKVAGTGFFADADGTIYTLSSLVGDGLGIAVTHAGRKYSARLLAKDKRSGVALVKVDGTGATPFLIKGDCRSLHPASPVVVIGYPLDHDVTPSFGVVGGLDRKSKGKFFTTTHIRANVPVQKGQGGSPVLNVDGKVVGVLVSGFDEGSGCFVLPIRAAEKVRSDYARFGNVRHGWAGVTIQEIPLAVEGSRMAIDIVDPGGPAAAAGFKSGDVVLRVGDMAIDEPEDALDASFFLTAGEPVTVRVARGSGVMEFSLTPAEHPAERKGDLQALGAGGLTPPAPAANP